MITFNTAYKSTAESAKEITEFYFKTDPDLSENTIVEIIEQPSAVDDTKICVKIYVANTLVFEYEKLKT